ncbi:MAG: RtcB family protein [Burkholderiales bacterium]|nr:RtcB family protein [Burkholderiales bacterium]
MDLSRLAELTPHSWKSGRSILYGSSSLIEAMDEKVLEQISNVSRLPGLVGAAMTMPDAHWGYGFPIGGVAAFDAEQGGIVSAGGVGFDISCGIRCLRTSLKKEDLEKGKARIAEVLFRKIPAGVGEGGRIRVSSEELETIMISGAKWAVDSGYGNAADLEYVEERGRVCGANPAFVSDLAKKRQFGEMGTLGSGNHYLEIQVVDRISDPAAAKAFGIEKDGILVSIHCGSRGFGHQIGTDYLVLLARAAKRLGLSLPDRELACAPIRSPEGEQYLGAMNCAINVALANRQILSHLAKECLDAVFPGILVETLFDVSHNTCKLEKHVHEGREKMLHVHRKGATRAFGPNHPDLPQRYRECGQPVIIGGSMGTGSWILAGNEDNPAFCSASHGAGRAMSRSRALRQYEGRKIVEDLAQRGILIRTRSMRGAAEEAPDAYKDVELVAEDTERANLARRVAHLSPSVCIKG